MNIVIDNIEQFKAFFDVIYDMSSELAELQLYPDRMTCAMLDRGKTRFFHVTYDASFFDVYSVEDVSSIVIFVEDFHKLLKSTNKKDTLCINVNDPYLVATIESENGNRRVFEFVLPSEEVISPVPPHGEFPIILEVDVGELKQSVKDIQLVGTDLFSFQVNENNLILTSDNNTSINYANSVEVELEKGSSDIISSKFNRDYIAQMLKFEKISKKVKLKIGQDYPLFYAFEDKLMGVTINGMIAPQLPIEED